MERWVQAANRARLSEQQLLNLSLAAELVYSQLEFWARVEHAGLREA